MKVHLLIGGWTYTNEKKHFDSFASTEDRRKTFAAACVALIKDYRFDGIDVDWEYPQDEEQGAQFLPLLKEVRSAMDEYAESLLSYGDDSKAEFLLRKDLDKDERDKLHSLNRAMRAFI